MTDFAGSGAGARMSVGPGIVQCSHYMPGRSVIAGLEAGHIYQNIPDHVVEDAIELR